MKADLHIHTIASDGHYTPTQIVQKAKKGGLKAIAITDHDTVGGVEEALKAGKKYNFEVIPGVEFSCGLFKFEEHKRKTFHLVGLFIDHTNKELVEALHYIRTKAREERLKIMLKNVNEYFDVDISYDYILELRKEIKTQPGSPHIIQAILRKGLIDNIMDYNKISAHIDVPVQYKIEDALRVIKNAGGLSIFAHPIVSLHKEKTYKVVVKNSKLNSFENVFEYLKKKGLNGVEMRHIWDKKNEREFLKRMVKKYHLLKSGGTDFHKEFCQAGRTKKLGQVSIPYSYVEEMKSFLK